MVNCWVHIQFWGVASTSGSDNLELTVTGFPFEVDGVGYSGSCGVFFRVRVGVIVEVDGIIMLRPVIMFNLE